MSKWRIFGGFYLGLCLASMLFVALVDFNSKQSIRPKAMADEQRLFQQLEQNASFKSDTFPITTLKAAERALKQRAANRHALSVQQLLQLRQNAFQCIRACQKNQQTESGRARLLKPWAPRTTNNSNDSLEDSQTLPSRQYALGTLFIDSIVTRKQLPFLEVALISEEELAQIQLNAIKWRSNPSSLTEAAYQREVVRLQLQDSHVKNLSKIQLDSMRQQEQALARILDLRRAELRDGNAALSLKIIDSCRLEIAHLQWLDTCRQAAVFWFPQSFGAAYALTSGTKGGNSPSLHAQINQSVDGVVMPSKEFDPADIPRYLFAILAVTAPFIGGYSIIKIRQELQAAPTLPARELEPLVLQLLLVAYASTIRDVLLMPRKIKRFSGKVRLQYYLLEVLSQRGMRHDNQFQFGPTEQVLAFLLLLLIEKNATPSLHTELEFKKNLTSAYDSAVNSTALDASVYGVFDCKAGKISMQLEQGPNSAPQIIDLSTALKSDNAHRLLKQLYWMNAGLLV